MPLRRVALLIALVASLAGAAQEAQRPRYIAILKFKSLRADIDTDWIGEGAAETLTTKLTGVPGLVVVERAQVAKVIEEQNFQQLDIADPKTAVKLGKFIGVERIVIGSYVCDGTNLMFNVRVVDVQTTAVVNASTVTGSRDKIFDTIFQLAEAVVQSFDKKVTIVDNRPAVRTAPPAERIVLSPDQRRMLRERGTTSRGAYEAIGRALVARDADEQIRWYTKAIECDPGYSNAYNDRGNAYQRKGDLQRAMQDYGRAVQADAKNPLPYYNRANVFAEQDQYDRALSELNRAVALKPDFALAYGNRALVLAKQGLWDQSIADCDRAIQLNPLQANAYNNRGIAYKNKSDLRRAMDDYAQAIRINPYAADPYTNRGNILRETGHYAEALREFSQAIALNPQKAEPYYGRGTCHYAAKRYDLALQDYGRAIQLAPDDYRAYFGRANTCNAMRRFDQAIADATKAIELKPDAALAYYMRGFAYGCKNDVRNAILNHSKAIELNPNYGDAYKARAIACLVARDYDRAWADVRACRRLGAPLPAQFIDMLSRASGRRE